MTDETETQHRRLRPFSEAGNLLTWCRHRAGKTQEEVAESLEITDATYRNWERGFCTIKRNKFKALTRYLKCSDEETFALKILSYPEMKALSDPEWLPAQEPKRQAGLLLAAFRARALMTITELCNEIYVSQGTGTLWESGKIPINTDRADLLKKALGLSRDEVKRLMSLSLPFQHGSRQTVLPRGRTTPRGRNDPPDMSR